MEHTRPELADDGRYGPWRRLLIGRSRALVQVCEVIELVAAKRCTVLIGGETGTGKEMVARALHAAGNRASLPMVPVNCTALPASLIETELFGHAKGAFTGAYASRIGRFEQAHRSSIFLDEIGDLPLDAQAKLLRVLQEQEFQRVGASETIKVDVRVIAASNIDLERAVRERRFREDLYYRLNVVPIELPPLRERREDIPLLTEHFLEKIRAAENSAPKEIAPDAVEYLMQQDWPGNVRQLEHAIQMAFALSGERRLLGTGDFAVARRPAGIAATSTPRAAAMVPKEGIDFDEAVSGFELALLNQALAASGGNKARAADLLRIKRTTLLAKIKTLNERSAERAAVRCANGPAANPVALVVEPDVAIRRLIVKTLQSQHYRVLEAAASAAAIDLFECWSSFLSLAIAPGDEPGLTGGLLERLRRETPDLPTVLLVNDPDQERNGACTQNLLRPFSAEDLLSTIEELRRDMREPVSACA
ncbi:MAG: sigma 54-interacting transcriptional regulator [Bryobacteraceae bacterium]